MEEQNDESLRIFWLYKPKRAEWKTFINVTSRSNWIKTKSKYPKEAKNIRATK
jgi:hypothetical protein